LDEHEEFFIMKLRYEGERLVETVDSLGEGPRAQAGIAGGGMQRLAAGGGILIR